MSTPDAAANTTAVERTASAVPHFDDLTAPRPTYEAVAAVYDGIRAELATATDAGARRAQGAARAGWPPFPNGMWGAAEAS